MTAPSILVGSSLAAKKQALASEPPLLPHSDLHTWTHTLLFAPHPDDESLGCGGLIALLRRRQQRVTVVFTSDGAMSHPNSRRYDRAARVALREQEAREACAELGVTDDNVHFLRYPDTAVPRLHQPGFDSAAARIAKLLAEQQPSHVLIPWRRDPHCDHRATWELCREATSRLDHPPRWVEYPIWMWNAQRPEDLPQEDEVIAWRVDVSSELPRKWRAIDRHRSQLTALIDDDPKGFRLSETMLDNFRRDTELFFEDPDKKRRSLATDYFDGVYATSDDPWSFETSDYERQKYQHSLESLSRERYGTGLEIGCSIGVLSQLLAEHCEELLSIDIAEKPLVQARRRLADQPHVRFERMTVPEEFPAGGFDLIVVSEVGYYWSPEDLQRAIAKIKSALRPGGELLLVHFTPYVPDYPLTGDEVHEAFANELGRGFRRLRAERAPRYRLETYVRN